MQFLYLSLVLPVNKIFESELNKVTNFTPYSIPIVIDSIRMPVVLSILGVNIKSGFITFQFDLTTYTSCHLKAIPKKY